MLSRRNLIASSAAALVPAAIVPAQATEGVASTDAIKGVPPLPVPHANPDPDKILRDLVAIVGKWGAIADIVHGLEGSLQCEGHPFEDVEDGPRYDRIEARLEALKRWACHHVDLAEGKDRAEIRGEFDQELAFARRDHNPFMREELERVRRLI